jgi:hypothetical protein
MSYILRKNSRKSETSISPHDINFLRELGDSDIVKVAQYELSQMYAVSLDEIEKLISSEETMN